MDFLAKALPTIVTTLAGPVAGLAAKFVADRLGLPESTVEAVKAAVSNASPEQLLQLKQADTDLQKFLAEMGIKSQELDNADRANARNREIATGDRTTPRVLAYLVTAGFFSMLVYMLIFGPPSEGAGSFWMILGTLGSGWLTVMNYYFGSTDKSAAKTEALLRNKP